MIPVAFLAAALLLSATETAAGPPEVGGWNSPDEGMAASAWWFRTERGTVLVGAPVLVDHARVLRNELEARGGLPGAVLLLSRRPDSTWGASALAGEKTRVWTSRAIAASLESGFAVERETLLREGLPLDRLPRTAVRATNTFSGTLNLGFEGFTLRLMELSEAGSSAPLVAWVPQTGDLFAGDLVSVKVHPDTRGMDHRGWQVALDALARLRPARVFPGRGTAAGPESIGQIRRYLETLEESVRPFVTRGKEHLSPREIAAVRSKFLRRYPDWRLPGTVDRSLSDEYVRQHRLRFDVGP